jgi:uncharacterized protein (TIGR01319 family)
MSGDIAVAVDFGSTFTKVTVVDLEGGDLVGTASEATTVESDISRGLFGALRKLGISVQELSNARHRLACSSAKGGLRIIAVGLVPSLTAEAARLAALGAGGKVVGTYGPELSDLELSAIQAANPDIVLLSGGTDGGDKEVALHNALKLARLPPSVPIVVACNKVVVEEAVSLLSRGGRLVKMAANVLPRLNRPETSGAQDAIRDVFLERIVDAKGLRTAEQLIDGIIIPTPVAVLYAARLLAHGTDDEAGLGELVVLDPGGATTDVHSVANGVPHDDGIYYKGLPEPYVKRTVEGDLGIRINAECVMESAGSEWLANQSGLSCGELEVLVHRLVCSPALTPATAADTALDAALACFAAKVAMKRHAGRLEERYGPFGKVVEQRGKDLTEVRTLVGTGGILAHHPHRWEIMAACVNDPKEFQSLRPRNPRLAVDTRQILAATGLLAQHQPTLALRLMKKHLSWLDS